MYHLIKTILVKSVIDTYENTGPIHLSQKYSIGIVEGGRENFACIAQQKTAARGLMQG